MPFYLRKSVSAGPFRFNFSNSGVGVSVGVRGLRIGTGPRGHYIHAGRNGFYYRASLGRAGERSRRQGGAGQHTPPSLQPVPGADQASNVEMVAIESADAYEMQDEAFADVLREINEKSKQSRLSVILAVVLSLLGFGGAYLIGPQGLLVGLLALPGFAIGYWLDSYRRITVLFYNVDEGHQRTFGELAAAFDRLAECSAKWHVQARGTIHDMTMRKRNAGASHLVNRTPTALTYRLPAVIQCNTTPPAVRVGKQHLYFFPDVILVEQGNQFGAVSYADLQVRSEITRFIESGGVPGDAQVVDHTWQYPNKSGGPDRRFNNNTQIPVCLYESIQLESAGGLNEMLEFSRVGLVDGFVHALRSMPPSAAANAAASLRPWSVTPQQQQLPPAPASVPEARAPIVAKRMSGLTKVAVALLVVVGALVLIRVSVKDPANVTPVVNASAPLSATPPPSASASQPLSSPPQTARQAPPASTPALRNDVPLTTLEVRDLQTRLKALGYDPGDLDGITGPQTAAAIRRFEAARSLPVQGSPDRQTLERVRDARPVP